MSVVGTDGTTVLCRTCAVEHAEAVGTCQICADERQYVPAEGQVWTTLGDLFEAGVQASIRELEPNLFAVSTEPHTGIGHTTKLLRTSAGVLMWDPLGYVDDRIAEAVRSIGTVTAIAASHPHMFGAQVEWSHVLGDPPVLVPEADARWVRRPDPVIATWSAAFEVLPGVTLSQPGGHFPGSAMAHWAAGASGRGVLLTGDTVLPNPDRKSVSFMRSYPNYIPLSAAVTERVAAHLESFEFDRLYGNFDIAIESGARASVRRSADRHKGWVSGEFDHLT